MTTHVYTYIHIYIYIYTNMYDICAYSVYIYKYIYICIRYKQNTLDVYNLYTYTWVCNITKSKHFHVVCFVGSLMFHAGHNRCPTCAALNLKKHSSLHAAECGLLKKEQCCKSWKLLKIARRSQNHRYMIILLSTVGGFSGICESEINSFWGILGLSPSRRLAVLRGSWRWKTRSKISIYIYTYICVYVYIYIYIYIHVFIYLFIHVFIYISIYFIHLCNYSYCYLFKKIHNTFLRGGPGGEPHLLPQFFFTDDVPIKNAWKLGE